MQPAPRADMPSNVAPGAPWPGPAGDAPTVPTLPRPTPPQEHDGSRQPARTKLALAAGSLAAKLSRAAGRGAGGMIGGKVTLALQPHALADLTRSMKTVLVTGTNGKTTTTAMLSRAVNTLGPVASNRGGANMTAGLVAALTSQQDAPYGVLEIDEAHVPAILREFTPEVVLLLNLSRDQIDRMGEVRRLERVLRDALSQYPSVTVVANCDDVMVASVAAATQHPVWVSAGAPWQADAAVCPRCGELVHDRTGQWWCPCGLSRPQPAWTLEGRSLRAPDGRVYPLTVNVPGRANLGNAAMAAAAAVSLGAPLVPALQQISSVSDVAGRYRVVDVEGRHTRLLLAKNPAGWRETLSVVAERNSPVVLAINAQEADGRDLSWLWDVPFGDLAGRQVVVSGERAVDMAVRLTYAQVQHTVVDDPRTAITWLPPGQVDLIGNYTAFRDLTRRLTDGT
jgi:UDP-N-acetylmuramyl tripeptide synthase